MRKNKIILTNIIWVILVISVFLNVKNQFFTLEEAKDKNKELKNKIETLKSENLKLTKQIEYATSSAFVSQQIHDKLALGSENDVWLVLPTIKEVDLRPEANEGKNDLNYKLWLNLFTQ